jgi:hypothetical protein
MREKNKDKKDKLKVYGCRSHRIIGDNDYGVNHDRVYNG